MGMFAKLFGTLVKHPTNSVNHDYIKGRVFNPGAENFFPIKTVTDPLYRLRGAGTPAGSLRVLQPPQSFAPLAVPTNGLGGQQPGNIIFQPSQDAWE